MEDGATLQPGTEVGHYRVVRVIGRGGFGITYEAWDTNLKRPVAIKEYYPHGIAGRAGDGIAVVCQERGTEAYDRGLERFLEEARALAQFHDSRIVRVHGFHKANNTAFMVMDMEQGTLLREHVLQQGVLATDAARRVLSDILHALQVVHGRNYLHRDIKPSNLMRRPDGQIVLLDFGSARMAQLESGKGHTVVVTPGYAPIEQYDADTSQGPGIDLYATGASLLFCLTGEAPPDGLRRAVAMQSNEPDPIEPLLRAIVERDAQAQEVCDLIRWLMRPQAAQRPASASEALSGLRVDTWPSEPTLLNPPPANKLAEMRSIPSRLVEPMRQLLEQQIGAAATPLLFGCIRSARSAQDLIDRIADQVADGAVRNQVVEGLRRILGGAQTGSMSTVRTAVPTQTASVSASRPQAAAITDEATTQLLATELAKYIGPIANMLVKRNNSKAASRKALIEALAAEIPETADRSAFLKAVERMPAFAG